MILEIDPPEASENAKYRAPALDKGLDILELLAAVKNAQSLTQIGAALRRSKSELFRVLLTLERRGYVQRVAGGEGYALTNKMFAIGLDRPSNQSLIEAALPHMRDIADTTSQSCHLVVRTEDEIVVIHRVESGAEVGFSVRVGYRRKLTEATSGLVLLAFGSDTERGSDPRLANIAKQGHAAMQSDFVDGITDLSVPILSNGQALAALTVPFVRQHPERVSSDDTLALLHRASGAVSAAMIES